MSGPMSFLCVDGLVLGNACQTATYIRNGLACDKWRCPLWFDPITGHCLESSCTCHLLTDEDGVPFQYDSPGTILGTSPVTGQPIYEACWFSPINPASAEFLGIVICDREVGQKVGRKVTDTTCGAVIGPPTRGAIEVTFEAWIVASSRAGALFGYNYLADGIGIGPFADSGCPDRTVTILEHCGSGDDLGVRRLTKVATTSPLEDITPKGFDRCCGMKVQWTMTSESAFLFGDREFCTVSEDFADLPKLMATCTTANCPEPPASSCGPNCSVIESTQSTSTQRPRTECGLYVYPGGETCPETAMEDYSECTWIPIPAEYPEDTVTSTGDTIININTGDEEECVDCPAQLVWDGVNLTWEPLPGFEQWWTPGEPIDYAACCPVILRICQPNPEPLNPIQCATSNGIALNPDNTINWPTPSGTPPEFNPLDSGADGQVWLNTGAFMDCLGITYPNINDDQSTLDPDTGLVNGTYTISFIAFDPDIGCYRYGIRTITFTNSQTSTVNVWDVEIPGSCSPLVYEAQVYIDPPAGPVCCKLTFNSDGSVTPLDGFVVDFAAALASGQCTFEVDCPTEDMTTEPPGPNIVTCPKVVHVELSDPSDPLSNTVIISPVGAEINEIDTVIIDNNPTDPITVTSSFLVRTIDCDNPCHRGGIVRPDPTPIESTSCYCRPILFSRICKEIPASSLDQVVGFSVNAGSFPLRNTRIRMWPNPHGMPGYDDDPDFWECRTPCSTVEIGYVEAGSSAIYDAECDRLSIRCKGADFDPTGITGAAGGRFIPGAMKAGVPMIVCVEVDLLNTSSDMTHDIWTQSVSVPVPA